VGVRWAGPSKAAAKGAVAAVIRTVGTDDDAPHTGVTDRAPPQIPSFAIANADADKLHTAIAEKKEAKDKKGVHLELKLSSKWFPDSESANVVGDVPAVEKPDEVVVMGAHLDSWDLATGAIDDGAGCAIVIEAARLLGRLGVHPRRTVRVVLYAAEENELAGGRGYAHRHEKELGHHVAAMEADSGTDAVYAFRFLGGEGKRAKLDPIVQALKPLGIEPEDHDAFGGADISPLRKSGVPIVDLAQDFSRYFDNHHTPNDKIDKINKEALEQAAAAFAITAWGIAQMDGDLGRVPEEKHDAKW
jgi:Zn-dependent M28 family amino/carboxypeptidase